VTVCESCQIPSTCEGGLEVDPDTGLCLACQPCPDCGRSDTDCDFSMCRTLDRPVSDRFTG